MINAEMALRKGTTYNISVEGFDPRDILKGHYIRYKIKWDLDLDKTISFFKLNDGFNNKKSCLCYNKLKKSYPIQCTNNKTTCDTKIKGMLTTHFYSIPKDPIEKADFFKSLKREDFEYKIGIEKYYIPETHAKKLEKLLLEHNGSISFKVNNNGKAILIEFNLDNKEWELFFN
jgi:uncharacterized membrane-anchored protein